MKRLGLLGGTFDPIHIGHLVMASYAIDALELDEVWFMPAQTPPHKQRRITEAHHRATMCQLAVGPDSRFAFSDLDLRGEAPSYTSELLARIHGLMPESQLVFLIGADSLIDFPTWHEPERILSLTSLGVAERPGSIIDSSVMDAIPGMAAKVHLFDSPLIELSSTEIRDRHRRGKSIAYLVTDAVKSYIEQNELYREPAPLAPVAPS